MLKHVVLPLVDRPAINTENENQQQQQQLQSKNTNEINKNANEINKNDRNRVDKM